MAFGFKHPREKTLGKVRGKRRYDLPLDSNDSTKFLITLVGLMSFLSVLGLLAFFILSGMTERWTSGLKGKMTVEITLPSIEMDVSYDEQMQSRQKAITSILETHPAISSFTPLTKDQVYELVEPWMDKEALISGQIPLPALITVEVKPHTDPQTIKILGENIESVASGIKLDTHESWLKEVLNFAHGLQVAALSILIVIIFTTVTAITGAVHARLKIYKADVELLHLMGAADQYIARQFQRHALRLALIGSACGTLCGILLALGMKWLSGNAGVQLLPDFQFGMLHYIILLCLPLVLSALAAATAQFTVKQELLKLP